MRSRYSWIVFCVNLGLRNFDVSIGVGVILGSLETTSVLLVVVISLMD